MCVDVAVKKQPLLRKICWWSSDLPWRNAAALKYRRIEGSPQIIWGDCCHSCPLNTMVQDSNLDWHVQPPLHNGHCFNHCSQTKYGWFPANILAQQISWRLLSIRQIWWQVAYVEKTIVQNSVSHEGSNCHRCQGCDCSLESLSRTLRGREIDAIWLSRIWAALTRNICIDSVLIIQNYRWQPYISLAWQKTLRRSRLAIPAIVCSFHICLCIYKTVWGVQIYVL